MSDVLFYTKKAKNDNLVINSANIADHSVTLIKMDEAVLDQNVTASSTPTFANVIISNEPSA